jgi:2-keto-4-pentenoate hydratase
MQRGFSMSGSQISAIAARLRQAERDAVAIPPFAAELGLGNTEAAYAVQAANTKHASDNGRRIVGRKIGLTSQAVQTQLGVDQPDYGTLFADMEVAHGGSIPTARLIWPRVEAEIALVLDRDLSQPDLTLAELMRSVAFAVPALEIVDSRVADWKITIVDTIADNGSSARFVLGLEPRRLCDVELETCGMVLYRDVVPTTVGSGAACLGHPLKSALWLARTMANSGTPLCEGDVVLTGALGPMCDGKAGQHYEARFGGFASVEVTFA